MRAGLRVGIGRGALIAGLLALALGPPVGAQAEKEGPAVAKVQAVLRVSDSYAVAELLEQEGEPKAIARRYYGVMNALYWKKRDLPAMIVVARSGIHYCLSRAKGAAEAEAADLRGLAKTMAYDLASFTWPGWNEPDILPTMADEAIGLDAARLNLRLAVELKRGAEPMLNAHWVLGAQQLPAGQYAGAIRSFEQSAELARAAKARGPELMATGYALLAKQLLAPAAETEKALAANAAALVKEKDGQFFQEQIATAQRVFAKRFKK
ncbi:MAG: hypothetical protein ACO1SX_11210 [Actinomycetota bacterium]